YSAIRIGPVVKRDVMKASTMLEHEPQFATILAFDVKVEKEAQEMADSLGVKIFQADIIYHLFDKFMAYREELKQKKREEFKSIAVFPCKLKYSAIRIGPVVKRDVMKASTMLEHEPQFATILAFDVKVEKEAQEMADSLGVKIFQADIIYHLFDKFMAYREELKQKKREEFKSIAVFPCKLKILPQFIFNSRDPIVMGVMVENGIVKVGTPICVPSKEVSFRNITL
uniref:Translation initiation factor IF- 2 domain-containing protein n=1 Tax=Musca domestica TaxID=7370 RepID=A0A1I8NDM2_MUSDO